VIRLPHEAAWARAEGHWAFGAARGRRTPPLFCAPFRSGHCSEERSPGLAKQAYNIRRDLLWAKLDVQGLDGACLAAVRALYVEVPMAICADENRLDCFLAMLGLKQGCPPCPTLFGLYIDDFKDFLMAAVRAGSS
jgi:hypothetical protein